MRSKPPNSLGILVLLPLWAAACTVAGSAPPEETSACSSGSSRVCVGAENCNGTQTCEADKWEACRCDSVVSPGPDASSGTDTTCSPTIHCASGETYEICTTTLGTQCIDITYAFTKGESHACASCSDCSEAAATAAAQCGSSPTHSSPPPGDAGPGKDSAPPPDSSPDETDAGVDADDGEGGTGDTVCGEASDQSACASCCEDNHEAGNAFLYSAVVSCACASGGPCQKQCASEACAGVGPASGDACDTCLNDSLSSTGACEGPVLASCDTNADCLADIVCQDNECAGLPSP